MMYSVFGSTADLRVEISMAALLFHKNLLQQADIISSSQCSM